MELKDFISKTISDIIEGIDCVSCNLKEKNRRVELNSSGDSNRRHIEFDVAVMASNKSKNDKSGDGKIKVWGIFQAGGKIQKTAEDSNSTVSRIKFGIRIKDIRKEAKKKVAEK